MTDIDVKIAAQRMMAQYNQERKTKFYDHWLHRLGLDPVVAKLEVDFAAKEKVRIAKLKRRGKRN